jgi:dipeptidyl aminopeptidase/acylaminoacyl peptidase
LIARRKGIVSFVTKGTDNVKTLLLSGSIAALSIGATASAQADDTQSLAARFGALDAVQDISISPDGKSIAYITPTSDAGAAVMVIDLADGVPKPIATGNKDQLITNCAWSSNTRLVCSAHLVFDMGGSLLGYSRAFAVNADGSDLKQLTPKSNSSSLGVLQEGGDVIDWSVPDRPNAVLMTRQFVPEDTTGHVSAVKAQGLGVESVDTQTLKRSTVEGPRGEADEYISDGQGVVRIMGIVPSKDSGYLKGTAKYYYRTPNSRDWKPLAETTFTTTRDTGFTPVAVDSDKNVVYGFDDKDGFQALYSIALDGSLKEQLVEDHPGVDVDGLIEIGRTQRVVGVTYATERRTTDFFDPQLRALSSALSKALGGEPVEFLDASEGENQLLLIASSDTDPGTTYLFDKASKHLAPVLPERPQLAGMTLAKMTPVTYPAADGTMIPAYLTLPPGSDGKNLPAIVMPHGGPGARDEWGFDWLVQFFAASGYAVLQPNYRGSAGYGSQWYEKNGFQSWRTAIGDVDDAGRWLQKQGIAAPGKLAIFGWSYGGYAALQSQVLDPDLFKAVVAVAPVTDLDMLRDEWRGFVNFEIEDRFIGEGPHVAEGSPARHADAFKAPVLLFHGDQDRNVGVGESRTMADRLKSAGKSVEYVEFAGLDHQLRDAGARTRLLSESDAFLRKALGLK